MAYKGELQALTKLSMNHLSETFHTTISESTITLQGGGGELKKGIVCNLI